MLSGTPEIVAVPLQVRLATDPVGSNAGCCDSCRGPLVLHQPDEKAPNRLLGVCSGCGAWMLIEMLSDNGHCLVVQLPDPQTLSRLTLTKPPARRRASRAG